MTEFSFASWCKDNSLPENTVKTLTDEHFTERELILEINDGWISELKDLAEGEKVRLRLAIGKLSRSQVEGAVGGIPPFGGARPKIKTEAGVSQPSVEQEESGRVDFPTTGSLSRHRETNAQLAAYLNENAGQLAGLRDLLSLAGIQANTEAENRGELNVSTPPAERANDKPLLIKDFIKSNIHRQYVSVVREVSLGDNTKLVVEDKGSSQLVKKPEVHNYTVELWCAANSRIILHLIKTGVSRQVLQEYAEYTSWISDFLEIYVQRGVYCLDEQHRIRVAAEGRRWNDIYCHDRNQWLIARRIPQEISTPTPQRSSSDSAKKPKSRQTQRPRKQLDHSGNPLCFNYNSKRGCENDPCTYTHLCNNPGCLGSHSAIECGRMGPRLQKK